MENILSGKKVCILTASGFAEDQFSHIQKMLNRAGASVSTVAPENGLVHGWLENAWGHYFPIEKQINEAMGSDFDMVIIPGGSRAHEKMKTNLHVRRIIRHFFDAGKPMALIGEAIDLLALCDNLQGLEVSAPVQSVQALKTAGAIPSDQNITIDGHLLTILRADDDWQDAVLQHLAEDSAAVRQAA